MLAQSFLERVEDKVVVDLGVVAGRIDASQLRFTSPSRHYHTLMHLARVATIVENGAEVRYAFTEIRLERVDTDIHQSFELLGIPFTGFRVGKVDVCHSRLPQIPSVGCMVELCAETACVSFQTHCQTSPLARLIKYPFSTPSLKR
jgi:hypothetical protein